MVLNNAVNRIFQRSLIFYVEKRKPSPTFLTVLDEMWEGAKFRRIE